MRDAADGDWQRHELGWHGAPDCALLEAEVRDRREHEAVHVVQRHRIKRLPLLFEIFDNRVIHDVFPIGVFHEQYRVRLPVMGQCFSGIKLQANSEACEMGSIASSSQARTMGKFVTIYLNDLVDLHNAL